jgi:glyoxylase-like metal-dependent hydrolase (beta-lactamase superfamily II)
MQRISSGIFIETKYLGAILGAIVTKDGLLLVDSPPRAEDVREWFASLGTYGKPCYLALLDSHPDRALGARNVDLPRIAHDWTCELMGGWSDTFKGSSRPIGAETDQIKRITGVRKATPELSFSERMLIHLGERQIICIHRPGPTPGSIWVLLPEDRIVFVGDAVTVTEPPYLGEADIEAWLETIETLREFEEQSYQAVSSRDGRVDRKAINDMARFLRKVPIRLERLREDGGSPEAIEAIGAELIEDFEVGKHRTEIAQRRLQSGVTNLFSRLFPPET